MGCLHSTPLQAHQSVKTSFPDVDHKPTAAGTRQLGTHRSSNGYSNGNIRVELPSKGSNGARGNRVGADTPAPQPRPSSNGVEWARWEESGMGISASKENEGHGLKAAIAAEGTKVCVAQPPWITLTWLCRLQVCSAWYAAVVLVCGHAVFHHCVMSWLCADRSGEGDHRGWSWQRPESVLSAPAERQGRNS